MRSEIFTVMIETTISVTMKMPPIGATSATVSLVMYCFAVGSRSGWRYQAAAAAAAQAAIERTSRVKPRTAASRAEIDDDADDDEIENARKALGQTARCRD